MQATQTRPCGQEMVTDTVEINDLTPFQTVIEESPRKQQPARNHWSVGFKVELIRSASWRRLQLAPRSVGSIAICYRSLSLCLHSHILLKKKKKSFVKASLPLESESMSWSSASLMFELLCIGGPDLYKRLTVLGLVVV